MRAYKLYLIPVLLAFSGVFFSCSGELDLDEASMLSIEKQAMIQELEVLFDRAFTDPFTTREDYDRFFKEELLGDGKNFLTDHDVRMYCTLADMAIRMNTEFERRKDSLPAGATLFDLYRTRFEDLLFNRTLLGEVPQQLRQGERLDRFERKMTETTAFFDELIVGFKSSHAPDEAVLNTQWEGSAYIYSPKFAEIYPAYNDFQFMEDGTLDVKIFFMFPVITMQGGMKRTQHILDEDEMQYLVAPVEYTCYGGKVMFWIHLGYDPQPGYTRFERQLCYEFDYETEPGKLTLSNPHILMYMHPFLDVTGYGEKEYELNYFEELRQPLTLTAQ